MKQDHGMLHPTSDDYTKRRESNWLKAGIKFNGRPLTWAIFIRCVELQNHRCAVCGMSDALESLQADHSHKTSEFRGATCHFDNQRGIGVVERYGHCRNSRYTLLIQAYLASPPAVLFRKELLRVQGKKA